MLFISDAVVLSILDQKALTEQVKAALRSHAEGSTGLSDPRSLLLHSPGNKTFFHIKGAYLSNSDIAGFRLGGYPPRGSGHKGMNWQVLCDLKSAAPLAVVDAGTLFRLRVGATIAVTVEAFRSPNAKVFAAVGGGQLARASTLAMQALTPFRQIRVTDVYPEQRKGFIEQVSPKCPVEIVDCAGPAEACRGADVILTFTDANEPIVKAEWCGPGSLLISAGGAVECEEAAILGADKVFVDDWEQCTQLGDIADLYKKGKIQKQDIAGTIGEVVAGKVIGRARADERIVAIPQGLTILDVSLGTFVYERAKAMGLGVELGGA